MRQRRPDARLQAQQVQRPPRLGMADHEHEVEWVQRGAVALTARQRVATAQRATRLRITNIQPLNKAASDLLRVKRVVPLQASAGSVDAFIAEQTRVEIGLPTATEWTDAMLGCLSAGIDNLSVAVKGKEFIKVLAKDSLPALKDAY